MSIYRVNETGKNNLDKIVYNLKEENSLVKILYIDKTRGIANSLIEEGGIGYNEAYELASISNTKEDALEKLHQIKNNFNNQNNNTNNITQTNVNTQSKTFIKSLNTSPFKTYEHEEINEGLDINAN